MHQENEQKERRKPSFEKETMFVKLSTEAKLILEILMTENCILFLSSLCKENISTSTVETIYHVRIVSFEREKIITMLCGLWALQMNSLHSFCDNNSIQGHC